MLTASEIVETYSDIDANTTKAFVRDGEIFINTTLAEVTDPLHEFTHIILQIPRSFHFKPLFLYFCKVIDFEEINLFFSIKKQKI